MTTVLKQRKPGDRIRFQVMPWFFTEKTIYEGTILEVCDPPDGDVYYHVDAMIGKEHVKDGMVFEREVVKDPFIKKRWYGCHCMMCPPPPRKLRRCWMKKRYRAHQRERQKEEKWRQRNML